MRRTVIATLVLALVAAPGAASAIDDDASTSLSPPAGLTCQDYVTSEVANDPFAFGAAAAVSCPGTESEGFPRVDYLTLFRFPDGPTMGEYWEFRSDQNPKLPKRAEACADGNKGSAEWAHGDYFCYVSKSGGHALLRWTDDRTNTYGVLDATDSSIAPLFRSWTRLRGDGAKAHDLVAPAEVAPRPVEGFAQDGLPTLAGHTTEDGVIVLRDEDFCAYLLGSIWGQDSVILTELVFVEGTDDRSIEKAVETYAQNPPTDEYALERCVGALNRYRTRGGEVMPFPWWASENPVIPEVFATLWGDVER